MKKWSLSRNSSLSQVLSGCNAEGNKNKDIA